MRGSGGTDGGIGLFLIGLGLAVLGAYLFFDSVLVSTGPNGLFSSWMLGGRRTDDSLIPRDIANEGRIRPGHEREKTTAELTGESIVIWLAKQV